MKRPLLPADDRARLRKMADRADERAGTPSAAYARGVADVLRWLDGADASPMLTDVTR